MNIKIKVFIEDQCVKYDVIAKIALGPVLHVANRRFLRLTSETKMVWFVYSGDPKSAIFHP